MHPVKFTVDLTGYYWNAWPQFQILHQNRIVWNDCVEGRKKISLHLDCQDKDFVILRHTDKNFGENNVWDTSLDGKHDRYIQIDNISFDDVTIGPDLMSRLVFETVWTPQQEKNITPDDIKQYSRFCCHGRMSFNGDIRINFELPIYNWLILTKFKRPKVDSAYFSNSSSRWHYDRDREVLQKIKEIMNFD